MITSRIDRSGRVIEKPAFAVFGFAQSFQIHEYVTLSE